MEQPSKFQEIKTDRTRVVEAARLYSEGVGLNDIARRLDRHRVTIGQYLKSEGIDTRARRHSRYSFDEDFFQSIDTVDKAYWLGFLLADGNCGPRTVRSQLAIIDRGHLEKLARTVRYDGPIMEAVTIKRIPGQPDVEFRNATLALSSVRMRKSLMDKGWDGFKRGGDLTIVRSVRHDLRSHLLRGLFDGDGCIHWTQRSMFFTFVDAHETVATWYRDELRSRLGLFAVKVSQMGRKNAFSFHFGGNLQVRRIMDMLYAGEGPFLERKREKYGRLLERVPA